MILLIILYNKIIMSLIRLFLPESISNPTWYLIGRTINNIKYYSESESFDADEVYPNIYIGDLSSSMSTNTLKYKNIKNILTVMNGGVENYPDDLNYKIIHINDDWWVNIEEHFDEGVKFIKDTLDRNEKVLVHCKRGVSRSVTMVLAYLISEKNMSVTEAMLRVKSKRQIALPNSGFLKQLMHYKKTIIKTKINKK
jgi:protein-tyrosine phosphatase